MLESVRISRRQSEVRERLAALAAVESPEEAQVIEMRSLDAEYQTNETRLRAALIGEDNERREAGAELQTREDRERAGLIERFELRQAVAFLDDGRALEGPTAEIVSEMRAAGGFRGVPIPLEALARPLETRTGETVASGTPTPTMTGPVIDRLFAGSVAAAMGVQTVSIPQGTADYPIVSSAVASGWADGETAAVPGPTAFATTDRTLSPTNNLGVTMRITRRAMKQSGPGLEATVRRDMSEAVRVELDKAVFLGTGANGQPTGIVTGAAAAGVTVTAIDAAADYDAFRAAATRFATANAAAGPRDVRLLMRHELIDGLDATLYSGTAVSEYDRLMAKLAAIVGTSNALAAPTGSPAASTAVLTTNAGGVAPALLGLWGGMDLIRDPYADAASGGLRLTGILTADVAILRAAQIEILTGLQ
ncbi:MAG: phage major capsid protein [Pseudomonadota bacterium]